MNVWNRVAGSFWFEWHKEIRRHAGDDRLPSDLRVRLREHAQRSLARSNALRAVTPFPRRMFRDQAQASIASERRPIVAIEMRRRPDVFTDAIAWLVSEGYQVVRIGEGEGLQSAVPAEARFVICESLELQHQAYRTNTPSLLLNARDPFSGYPVRDDSLFTLGTAIDLDTGRVMVPGEAIDEPFVRGLRNCGFRGNNSAEILAATREMHEGLTAGWRESASQARFRSLVSAAGASLMHLPLVARWGPDRGFIGDGRLARWQAEAISR